ncbi:hypothetical protein JCM19047_477 [Bacillus sp. JCM 19047]|nr:hypothetical protein JCM19047_477 [Bacillus sp. JCM 19047]
MHLLLCRALVNNVIYFFNAQKVDQEDPLKWKGKRLTVLVLIPLFWTATVMVIGYIV